jgi:5-methylcytosine-specific restriction endonuclease McrA
MIRLMRSPLPDALRSKVEERVLRLKEYIQRGEEPPRGLLHSYRDEAIKAHLIAESHGKCVYCESKITHVYFGDVEHIKPKSIYHDERLDIENLVFACALCNNSKSDFYDETTPLLNPYVDDPDEELMPLGFFIGRRPGKIRARITIERLNLNRPALLERRKERIEQLQALADQYAEAPEGSIKNLIYEELCRQAGDDGEYAMIVRAYLEKACDLRCDDAA